MRQEVQGQKIQGEREGVEKEEEGTFLSYACGKERERREMDLE